MKKHLVVLAGIILCGTSATAQSSDLSETKKWAVGLSFSPDYNYLLPYHKAYKVSKPYYEEKGMVSVSFGINGVYKLSNRLGLELSVFYATKGRSEVVTYPATTYDPNVPGGGISIVAYYKQQVSYKYQFLEIPLKLNAYVLNKRFKIFPSLGFATNVFLSKNRTVDNKFVYDNYHKNTIPSVYMSVIAGIGFSYDVSKRLFVKLEPNYRQVVTSIVDRNVRGYFYSIGCNTGMYCRF